MTAFLCYVLSLITHKSDFISCALTFLNQKWRIQVTYYEQHCRAKKIEAPRGPTPSFSKDVGGNQGKFLFNYFMI